MSVIAAALKHMLAANMPHEVILAAVEDMERGLQTDEQAERRRAADRERQRQRRLRISADSADRKDSPRAGATRVEDKPLPTDIEPQDKKTSRGDVDAFRAGLAPDVSEEVITEFIKVRRKKRGALTGYAAGLFREDAAKCGMSVADAAKECVRSSWITVKPEYFASRQRAGPAPPRSNPVRNVISNLRSTVLEAANAEPDPQDGRYRPTLVKLPASGHG